MKRFESTLLAVLVAAATFGQASKSVSVSFPAEGDREVWVGPSQSPGDFSAGQSAQGTGISLPVPDKPENMSVYVHDKKTGNVASKPLAEVLKTGSWKVDPKDETRVFNLAIMVTSDGKPVASAVVKAKAGSESREALLTPGDKGLANLYNLPVGPVVVTVQYKSGTDTKSTPPQSFEAKLSAGPAKPKTIVVTDKVETIAEQTPPTRVPEGQQGAGERTHPDGATPVKPVEPAAPNPFISLINLVLGLAVIGAIVFGIYTYVKKNPKQVEDTLKKVGLAQQEPPVGDIPAAPPQPQPIKPIVLDDATPTAVVSPMPMAATTAVKNPRLVKSDGSVVLLQDGPNVVGREDGLAVSIQGESSVSRHHAKLEKTGDDVRVSDLGSTNGTFVNGAKLTGETLLKPGDNIQFGAVAFRFEV